MNNGDEIYMKKIVALFLALTLCFALCACGKNKTTGTLDDELLTAGVITIATSPDYEPYEFLDENGEMTGFDIELAKALGAWFEGYTIEFVSMSFDTIVAAVEVGTADLGISCFTYDPERNVSFSTPYVVSAQVAVVSDESGATTLDGLKGKNIGVQLGTTGADAATDYFGDQATILTQTDYGLLFESLKSGALDAVVCDYAVAQNYAESGNGYSVIEEKLLDESVSVIAAKEHTILIGKVNEAIEAFTQTDEYEALRVKWGV